MKKIKLYAERNTGSRYLLKLFAKNFDAKLVRSTVPNNILWYRREYTKNLYFWLTYGTNLGWKHAYVRTDWMSPSRVRDTGFVTLTKNPYSFLLSLYKRPYHLKDDKPRNLMEFLQRDWRLQHRDNMDVHRLDNPVALWNLKNKSYIELAEKFPHQVYNMTYEHLLSDYRGELDAIKDKLELSTRGSYGNISESTKEDAKSNTYYQDYYLKEEWRGELSPEHIEFINRHLDKDVMAFFQYEYL